MREINVMLVEGDQGPRLEQVDLSPDGLAAVLGSGEIDWIPVRGWDGREERFLSVVMVCRKADYEAMRQEKRNAPQKYLLCSMEMNGPVSLGAKERRTILRSWTEFGAEMWLDDSWQGERHPVSVQLFPIVRRLRISIRRKGEKKS